MEQKVSVIIPNYNHARFLEKRLDSVFLQRKFIDKIIILDDASSDESLGIIERYKAFDVDVVVNEVNSGSVFKQWEKGLSLIGKGSLVWIAESDDIAHADFLKEILNAFNDPEVVISYSRSTDINETGETIGLSYKNLKWANDSFVKKGSKEVKDHLYKQCTIPNISAVVFRRDFINSSFFSHNFKLCGDWYFYIRLLESGKIAYIDKPLNFHRFHQETVRNKSVRSVEVLNERLIIVKETCKRYRLGSYRYLSSMAFQIDLYISATKISDLIGVSGRKLFRIIKPYGFFLCSVAITLIAKRFVKRLFQSFI